MTPAQERGGGPGEDGDAGKRTPSFHARPLGNRPAPASPPAPPAPRRHWRRRGLQPALEPWAGARAGRGGQFWGLEPERKETEGVSPDGSPGARPLGYGSGR